jgi:hypothetical protein
MTEIDDFVDVPRLMVQVKELGVFQPGAMWNEVSDPASCYDASWRREQKLLDRKIARDRERRKRERERQLAESKESAA